MNYGYSIGRCGQFGWEWFAGLHAGTGEPLFTEQITEAQIWENRLHAEAQALLLVSSLVPNMVQRKAVRVPLSHKIFRDALGEALSK